MSPSPVSSTPILRAAILWSSVATAAIAVVGGIIGYLVAGSDGLWSALAGAVVAAVFLLLTSVSVLVANRWFGDALYVPIFFGIVLGGWFVKLVVFIAALFILRGQPWLEPVVFFVAIVASVVASLVVDMIVLRTMRIPHVSDVSLPGDDDAPTQPR
ncbi:hypothetical protein GCM10022219_24260 [Microbacterium oryzae]|uniref:Uncharacterized protein n=1 Tax=Microbacterium oryzae TaxID=743009 RepID=A0A6I6DTG5_9MICO|nr:hypothetical protein [Microbacterium oryzae]QGU27376.1 hypothetical protein D7D94_06615 [Microbacterium oryzae]